MIKNRWYVVLDAKEVGKKPLGVMRFGERLVFWRDSKGQVTCQVDRCCHRGAQLSIGKVVGDCIQCPFHGFLFDQGGQCTLIPSNGRAARVPKKFRVAGYPTREAHGWIWVYWGEVQEGEELPPLHYFDDIDESFSYTTFAQEWPVHYTRSVENQLDLMHLAFTHKWTIGFGGRSIVDGPVVERPTPDRIIARPILRKDDGKTPAKRPEELTIDPNSPHVEFRFPNIWRNYIMPKMHITAAFVPVDENRTITYVRNYQKLLTLPGLRWLVDGINLLLSKRILSEDRAHVSTQKPIRSDLHMDELLVAGDRPIIEYRKRRQQLLDEQTQDTPTSQPTQTQPAKPTTHPKAA